ncbi:SDR family NAD(P)-dependent oxidoreductase [Paenibacillus piri]|uniref:SDR family NAD(P)-dependent oxidoreductase n=1 Tax=Paenibacillus piri TaxID=2547395 RepID=A0A4R5KYJ4_9BACL|nr:SDR family NAD(P)-dependent oxidoreductase [Paenibacillus piri]TDG00319.1 SDR family NAD(P)-dependent oxidoreductase [Paenibacillus piri]
MTKVLVTGAAGFLGSHVTKELLEKGCHVIAVDNYSTGKEQNLSGLHRHERFTHLVYDVSDPSVIGLEELRGVEQIFHLASPASPKFYQAAPMETIAVNTIGTRHMLEVAKRNQAKLLFSSTSEAYGDPEVHPQSEAYRGNVNTWGPRACYDEAKRLGEVFCYEYHHRFQVEAKVVRIFNTYSAGLRNDDGRVISNFVTQAINGDDITVYGDGSQTRSFCYVDDNVRALQLVMEKDEATGEIINIGNPAEYAILEVAQMVKRLAESDSVITYMPLPQDDPKVRRPVIDKAKRLLGWEPHIDLEEGLRRTIQSYRNRLVAN